MFFVVCFLNFLKNYREQNVLSCEHFSSLIIALTVIIWASNSKVLTSFSLISNQIVHVQLLSLTHVSF